MRTSLSVSQRLAEWLRRQAAERGVTIEEYLLQIAAMPEDYRPDRRKRSRVGRPVTETGEYRRVVRQVLLNEMRAIGRGEHRAADVLDRVRRAAKGKVPKDWFEPAGKYRTKVDMVAAFARKDLALDGVIVSPRYGYWQLASGIRRGHR